MMHSIAMADTKDLPGLKSLLRLLPCLAALLISALPAQAQVCATPRKDGSPGTITGVINTYYPGAANVGADGSSITLGVATGAAAQITSGDLLLVIQMQDASINSANSGNYGNNTAGDPGSGYTSANGVGHYEFVRATNTVPLAGGTVNLVGGGGGGLLHAYNMTAVVGQGQRTFQVVRVPGARSRAGNRPPFRISSLLVSSSECPFAAPATLWQKAPHASIQVISDRPVEGSRGSLTVLQESTESRCSA